MGWYGPRTGDCSCCDTPCVVCSDCCTDSLPNSLDITFGSGWSEPTVDSGKLGCNDLSGDYCNSNLSGATINLTQPGYLGSGGLCSPYLDLPGSNCTGCKYCYEDQTWCPVETDACGGYGAQDATLFLESWFHCVPSGADEGKCRIIVRLWICSNCNSGGGLKASSTLWEWQTALFSLGGETCASLSKTAVYVSQTDNGFADTEGFCVRPGGASGNLTIDDGG